MQRLSYKERLRETFREEIECLISTVFNLDEMKQRIADTLALSDHALIADTPARASVSTNVMAGRLGLPGGSLQVQVCWRRCGGQRRASSSCLSGRCAQAGHGARARRRIHSNQISSQKKREEKKIVNTNLSLYICHSEMLHVSRPSDFQVSLSRADGNYRQGLLLRSSFGPIVRV